MKNVQCDDSAVEFELSRECRAVSVVQGFHVVSSGAVEVVLWALASSNSGSRNLSVERRFCKGSDLDELFIVPCWASISVRRTVSFSNADNTKYRSGKVVGCLPALQPVRIVCKNCNVI